MIREIWRKHRPMFKRSIAVCLAAGMLFTGAASNVFADGDSAETARLQLLDQTIAAHKDMLGGIQAAQRLEDYDYLWETLEARFPMMDVAVRQGVNPVALREKFRESVIKDDSDFGFYSMCYT